MKVNDILNDDDRHILSNHSDYFGNPDPTWLTEILLNHSYELSVTEYALLSLSNSISELASSICKG